jgi:hypothetical protein
MCQGKLVELKMSLVMVTSTLDWRDKFLPTPTAYTLPVTPLRIR